MRFWLAVSIIRLATVCVYWDKGIFAEPASESEPSVAQLLCCE